MASSESNEKTSTTSSSDSSVSEVLASRVDIKKGHRKDLRKSDSIPLSDLRENSSTSKESSRDKNRHSAKDASDDDDDNDDDEEEEDNDDVFLKAQNKEENVDDNDGINAPEKAVENNFKKEDTKRKSLRIALHLKDVFRSKKSIDKKSSDAKVSLVNNCRGEKERDPRSIIYIYFELGSLSFSTLQLIYTFQLELRLKSDIKNMVFYVEQI